MGFFSELLGTVATVGATLLGGPVAGTAVGTLLGGGAVEPTTAVGRVGGPVLTTAQLTAAGGTAQQIIAATGGVTACPTTTGRLRKRTIVETFDPATGRVCKQTIFAGGVAVRAADVAAAKRIFRQVSDLHGKLPRKLTKQSEITQLKNRLVKNALEGAGDKNGCP